MLVDRSAARAPWPVRALIWSAGVLGLGLIVLAVQQLLAEPAAADAPGLVDGVVGTVEQAVDPVSAALQGDTSATPGAPAGALPAAPPDKAPALDSPAPEPLAPVVGPLVPVAQSLVPAVDAAAPVVEAAAPVVEVAAPVAAPLADAASPLAAAAAPIVDAVAPVTTPLVEAVAPAVAPVVGAVMPAVTPVVEVVAPVVRPVVEAVAPVVAAVIDPVVGGGTGPPTDRSDQATSSLGDASHRAPSSAGRPPAPIGTGAAPLAVSGPSRQLGSDGDVLVPVLRSTGGDAMGGGAARGVPPGPPALAVPSPVYGGLGGSVSGGGAGPSALVAVLAGGLPGLGLARGGVVHDRAARLIGLVHGPGRLPG